MVILNHPARDADRLLRTVWSELAGGVVIPVDPARIAKALGIDVFEAELPASVSGAIRKLPNSDPTILLNRDDSTNRQRFTAAHELGHFMLHRDDPDEFEYVDYRDETSSTGTVEEERYANGFAANLLMPTDKVREYAKSVGTSVELAYRFRVSQEAMVNRLSTLGISLEGG